MSDTTLLIVLGIGWVIAQYLIPGAVSYFLLWRQELKAEAADPSHVHPRHLFTGA